MFKLYSKCTEYSLRAIAMMTLEQSQSSFAVKGLCQQAGVKESYARKGFQRLSRAGILQAANGPGGGYRLARSPQKIYLWEVVNAIDGPDFFDGCILGFSQCHDDSCCAIHHVWKPIKLKIIAALKKISLKHLINMTSKEAVYEYVLSSM